MKRLQAALILVIAALIAVAPAAARPKHALPGDFTIAGTADAQYARYMKASDVWCVWSGDHVIVHVNLKNTAIAHVTATIHPRYMIDRGGGTHGDSLGGGKNYGFDGGEFRSLWMDAGSPKGVPAKSPLLACRPYLLLIRAG